MSTVWLLVRKEVVTELRTRALASSMLVFALVVVVVLSVAVGPVALLRSAAEQGRTAASAVLWLSLFFAAILGLARNFTEENELDGFRGVLVAPVGREALYLGKVASLTLFVLAMEAVILPTFVVLYRPLAAEASAGVVAALVVTAVLATVGLVAVGVLFTALALRTGGREALLAGLVLPVVSPVLLGAVRVTAMVCGGAAVGGYWRWWALLGGFDLIFLALGCVLFQFVVEE